MKKKINLPFIPNEVGIPVYDQQGNGLRDFLSAWSEAYESGKSTEPSGERIGITRLPTIAEKTKPSQRGDGLRRSFAKS